jgi:hypothetical protein
MGEDLSGKDCIGCKHFRSFYEEYDCDEFEPRWCGRCLNELSREDDDYVQELDVCHLWEK